MLSASAAPSLSLMYSVSATAVFPTVTATRRDGAATMENFCDVVKLGKRPWHDTAMTCPKHVLFVIQSGEHENDKIISQATEGVPVATLHIYNT
jgi:hypothetical protein